MYYSSVQFCTHQSLYVHMYQYSVSILVVQYVIWQLYIPFAVSVDGNGMCMPDGFIADAFYCYCEITIVLCWVTLLQLVVFDYNQRLSP